MNYQSVMIGTPSKSKLWLKIERKKNINHFFYLADTNLCWSKTQKIVEWPSQDKKGDCSRILPQVRRLIENLWPSLNSVGLKPITSGSTRNAWADRKFLQTIVFLEEWVIVSALYFGEFRRFERGEIVLSLFTESYTFTDSMKIMRQINIVSIKIILLLSILRISQGTRDLRGNIFIISCLFLFGKDFLRRETTRPTYNSFRIFLPEK